MLRRSLVSLCRQGSSGKLNPPDSIEKVTKLFGTTPPSVNTGNGARSLYSSSVLGLDGYENYREKTRTQHMHNVDNFKRKMRDFVGGSSSNMIFTEDLKNIIHLADDSAEDKKLLVDMIDK